MEILTIRNLDPQVKARLRERAARNGRSMEAEARVVIAAAVNTDEADDLVAAVRRSFGDAPVELELPDRSRAEQRRVELP